MNNSLRLVSLLTSRTILRFITNVAVNVGLLGFILVCAPRCALAINSTWTFNGDGVWTDNSKWNNGIPDHGSFHAFIDDGDTAVTVTLNDARTVGQLTLGSDDTLVIESNSGVAILAADSFTNDGTIALTATSAAYSWLNMSTSTLTNSSTGQLQFQSGGAAHRYFTGDLINNGIVTVDNDASFDKSSASITNNGDFSIYSGKSLTVADGTFHQAGDLYLSGTLILGAVTLRQSAGTLHFDSGALIQNGTFDFEGGTIDGDIDLMNSTIIIDPTATTPASFRLTNSNTLASNVGAGHTITLVPDSSAVVLASNSSFTNDGTIVLSSIGPAYSWLNLSADTLTNSATGVLRFESGGTSQRFFSGSLVNDGAVVVDHYTSFDTNGTTITNNGQFTVSSGQTLAVTSETFNQAAGDFHLNGTLALGGTLQLTGGTLYAGVDSLIQNGTFEYQAGTIDGTAKLFNSTISIAGAATSPTAILMTGGNTLLNNIGAGHSLTIEASDAATVLTANDSFTNNGALHLASTGTAYSWLNAASHTVTNSATGLLHFQAGGTAVRYFTGHLVNNGTVSVDQQTFFDQSMGIHTNNGRINVALGATLHITGGGTLSNFSGNTLTGGIYDIAGVFAFDGADIHTLNAEVILHAAAGIVDESSADALNELSTIGAQGTLRLLDGASKTSLFALTNHGDLEMGGGLYFLPSVDNTATGQISGVGEIRANTVTSAGTVSPGADAGSAPGTLDFFGHYIQQSTGLLNIEIFGNDNSDPMNPEFDVLLASTATLAGTLGVSLVGFTPDGDDVFTILDAQNLIGEFDNVAGGARLDTLDGAGSFLVTYDTATDNVTLSEFQPVADFNVDGVVDAADYVLWRKVIGTPAAYSAWRHDFGRTVIPGSGGLSDSSSPAPEPTGVMLLVVGTVTGISLHRR